MIHGKIQNCSITYGLVPSNGGVSVRVNAFRDAMCSMGHGSGGDTSVTWSRNTKDKTT